MAFDEEDFTEKKDNKIVKESKTASLDHFADNLNKMVEEGSIGEVFNREKELENIIQILSKKNKSNPMIIGDPEVGKTALIEGLAYKIFNKDVEAWLYDKEIYRLNMAKVVAGTKYRGQFEERLEAIIKEVKSNENIILFIDDIHNVIGAGNSSGSMDASNMLKPALDSSGFKCIGSTTMDDYKKTIESDSALKRRFQKVLLKEPSIKETREILVKCKSVFEKYHLVKFTNEVIDKIIEMSDRYISYNKFPGKAIDLLDEIGSIIKLRNQTIPPYIKEKELEIKEIDLLKEKSVKDQDFELSAKLRDSQIRLKAEIKEGLDRVTSKIHDENIIIEATIDDVAFVINKHTGIPVSKLKSSDNETLLKMADELKNIVIGQDEAVDKVTETIQRSKVGINDPDKPIFSSIFLGSTGVGKSFLAKQLAKYLFGSTDSMVRFDMSEYKEANSVAKLIGSPPGYIGHEDKGQLTEAIKHNPYSVVLFDEIEKADKSVFDVLLQVLDDGGLKDSKGDWINFKNTIVLMTSNLGTRELKENKKVGFNVDESLSKDTYDIVMKVLTKEFRPEFLNRIDEKIVFNSLNKESISTIVRIELDKLIKRLQNKKIICKYTDSLVEYLVETGYDKDNGARPLKRKIEKEIGNIITRKILEGIIIENTNIELSFNNSSNEIEVNVLKNDDLEIQEVKIKKISLKKENKK